MATSATDVCAVRPGLIILLVAFFCLGLGCDRSPEDLEDWRNAQGGMAQLSQWAQDEGEPMDVRIRAVQIIVEEGADTILPRTLDGINEQERQQILVATMPTIEAMWQEQDFPELTDEMREEGAQIPIEDFVAVRAIDAIYRLMPYLKGEEKEKGQQILRDWMSEDQELRTQLADASIPLLLPLAGDGAAELLSEWIVETYDPRELAASLRRHAPDEEAHRVIDAAIAERAKKKHPELTSELEHAVVEAQSDGIAPYLEQLLLDDAVRDELFQAALNTSVEALGEEASPILSQVIKQRPGNHRWAAATNLIDARGVAGLLDIANALPDDSDAYTDGDDDELRNRATYICNYVNTNIERGDIEEDLDVLSELIGAERWINQVIGLQCAARTEARQLSDDIQALSDASTSIPAWGQRVTVGQFAAHVHEGLDVAEED